MRKTYSKKTHPEKTPVLRRIDLHLVEGLRTLLVTCNVLRPAVRPGLVLLVPARRILESARLLLGNRSDHAFDPATAVEPLRIAASDRLDPLFLPNLVSALERGASHAPVGIMPLSLTTGRRYFPPLKYYQRLHEVDDPR